MHLNVFIVCKSLLQSWTHFGHIFQSWFNHGEKENCLEKSICAGFSKVTRKKRLPSCVVEKGVGKISERDNPSVSIKMKALLKFLQAITNGCLTWEIKNKFSFSPGLRKLQDVQRWHLVVSFITFFRRYDSSVCDHCWQKHVLQL